MNAKSVLISYTDIEEVSDVVSSLNSQNIIGPRCVFRASLKHIWLIFLEK